MLKKLYDGAAPPNDGEFRTFWRSGASRPGKKPRPARYSHAGCWPNREASAVPPVVYPEFMDALAAGD
jgi:hypothetical protein